MPDERRRRLKELETTIEKGFASTVELGRALLEIRDEALYLELDPSLTFETYVKARWSFELSQAYRQIDAALAADAVSPIGEAIPITTESVGRELAIVLHREGPIKVAEAWTRVSDAYRGQRPPTARAVRKFLVAHGYIPKVGHVSTGKPNARILLGLVGNRITATEKRLDHFLEREAPKIKVAASTRQLAASYADRCQMLADRLRAFAKAVDE